MTMRHTTTPEQVLTMRWIPVQDASGRTRMEARWVLETTVEQSDEQSVAHRPVAAA
jgi:hypothetical protein